MQNVLFIKGNRNGYCPRQCGPTMSVGDLIEYLEQFDYDMPVYLDNDCGYTYGSINDYDIWDQEIEEDDLYELSM